MRVLHRGSSSAATPSGAATCKASTAPKTTPAALPAPATVTVNVLNATTTSGLASSVATQLKARGFKIAGFANDATNNATATQVRYGPSGAVGARLVQIYFPGSTLVATQAKDATVVVSLGSGFTTLASAAQIKAGSTSAAPAPTC